MRADFFKNRRGDLGAGGKRSFDSGRTEKRGLEFHVGGGVQTRRDTVPLRPAPARRRGGSPGVVRSDAGPKHNGEPAHPAAVAPGEGGRRPADDEWGGGSRPSGTAFRRRLRRPHRNCGRGGGGTPPTGRRVGPVRRRRRGQRTQEEEGRDAPSREGEAPRLGPDGRCASAPRRAECGSSLSRAEDGPSVRCVCPRVSLEILRGLKQTSKQRPSRRSFMIF
mmetsp:Transcript_34736/g.79272  ORF Transcript_34736/g.79272 Transcript_34736/m.79272 type:complete len:221 (+) Transcript_34736:1481-2143(+)